MHRFDATEPPKLRSAPPSPRSCSRGYPTQRRIPDEEVLRLYVEEKLDSSTIGLRAECTSKTDEEVLRLYVEEKLDSSTIGLRAECTSKTVLEIVRALGGVVRGRGGRGDRGPLKLTDAEIIRRYNDGASGKALAKQAGCSHTTLYGLLHRHGVRTRTPIERAAATKATDRARIGRAKG